MNALPLLSCPCGEPVLVTLPPPGARPLPCVRCATPLVQPGGVPREDFERSVGVALLVASVLAVAWMFLARGTGSAAHIALPICGGLIGLAARLGARSRGPVVQRTAALCFAAFVLFGEVLLYRGALLPRLVALHRDEGAPDAEVLAQQEFAGMEPSQYLHVELTLSLFVGVAMGLLLALLVTRAPVAVAAFARPREPSEGSGAESATPPAPPYPGATGPAGGPESTPAHDSDSEVSSWR